MDGIQRKTVARKTTFRGLGDVGVVMGNLSNRVSEVFNGGGILSVGSLL